MASAVTTTIHKEHNMGNQKDLLVIRRDKECENKAEIYLRLFGTVPIQASIYVLFLMPQLICDDINFEQRVTYVRITMLFYVSFFPPFVSLSLLRMLAHGVSGFSEDKMSWPLKRYTI